MNGSTVLHPMGWDAFGEPAEQFAILHGVHPRETTDRRSATFRRQMRMLGTSYDWSREIDSSDPSYYRWTQWFFLLLYKRGLAYRDTNWQWWCPTCQTTLSNHEVADGRCWRGHSGVSRKEIPAWFFRITAYADELLTDLDRIEWPERIKALQRNWIGRSQGYEIDFAHESGRTLSVFTTHPETLPAVTFLAISPEHPALDDLVAPASRVAVHDYIEQAHRKGDVERVGAETGKSGVFSGTFVRHPLTGEHLPLWVADYVLPTYGTGIVMGVPDQDARDLAFAQYAHLPVKQLPPQTPEEIAALGALLEEKGLGRRQVNYQMRDWLISRQRYWGAPIPIIHCPDCGEVAVPEDQLPVRLPAMTSFQPDGTGRSPLARVPDFVQTTCPKCGGPGQRETDTMGGFACSSWYFLRFASPHYEQGPFDPEAMRFWLPVDLYMGGAEHAVLHLLYARFWTKVMADAGLVPFREPFLRLLNQGALHAPDGSRMSKSRGNVITPDSLVREYGADTVRVYILFMAPYDQDVNWSTKGIQGARRFLERVWELYRENAQVVPTIQEQGGTDADLESLLHKMIRDVTEAIENLKLNNMIALLMTFLNALSKMQREGRGHTKTFSRALDHFLILLAPAAPHISEELWHRRDQQGSIHEQRWPRWDPDLAQDRFVTIGIQVNGRLRGNLRLPATVSEKEVQQQALQSTNVQRALAAQQVTRTYYIPGRVFNIVTEERTSS